MSASVEWMGLANCIGTDPEAFFPAKGGHPSKAVRATCANCLVQSECLTYALENDESGIWSGTSEVQRERMTGRRIRRFYAS